MYWSDPTANKIFRANLNGSNVEQLVDTSSVNAGSSVASLAIDAANGKIYFSHIANKTLYRANLDGSNVAAIAADGISSAQGVTLLRPSIMVTPAAGLMTSEGGGSASFKVSLNTPPKANVAIPISSSNSAEGRAAATSVTFTATNWNVPQTITVTGVNDSVVDGNKSYSIILGAAASADPDYAALDPRDVTLTNRDDETKFFVVDDATTNNTFRYGSDGTTRGNSSLATANSAPRGVAGSLAGDKYWVVDTSGNVFVYSNTGNLLGSWTADGLPKNAKPEGIATNGTDVWLVESSSDKVYRYIGAASRLSGTQTANSSFSLNTGNANPKDIVTDGQSFWVVDDATKTDKVFKYTTSGALVGSWTIDATNKAPTGIAIDPTNVNHLWIVDSGTDKVYQYNAGTTRISGSQSAALTFALASGNGNAQGIADPPAPASSVLMSNRSMFAAFGAATLQTSREMSISTSTKRRVAREQALASYLPNRYEKPSPASVTTEFERGPEKIWSELSAGDDHAATDLALTAVFAGIR
jgi:hypothetical protein